MPKVIKPKARTTTNQTEPERTMQNQNQNQNQNLAALEAALVEAKTAYWEAVDYGADELTIECRQKEMTAAWYAWSEAFTGRD